MPDKKMYKFLGWQGTPVAISTQIFVAARHIQDEELFVEYPSLSFNQPIELLLMFFFFLESDGEGLRSTV